VPEVVIVGGGISGVCLAWQLAERGRRDVLLLERDYLAAGPTGRSGAVVRCHYSTPTLVRLALEGRRFFERADELIGDDCGYRRVGFLALAGEADAAAVEAKVGMQREAGLGVGLLRGREILDVEPALELGPIALAAYEPDSGYADAVRTTRAVARRAVELGVEIRPGCTVRSIRVERGRVEAVVTDGGEIPAGTVVCAAGPWTRGLVGAFADLPLSILRNAMALFLRPPALERNHPVVIDLARRFYVRPYHGALSLTGSVDEEENQTVEDPDRFDRGVHLDEIELFGRRLGSAFPAIEPRSERGGWVGLYDVSPDWLHVIDELPGAAGLWVLCGTSGHGFKLAPAIGRALADVLTESRAAAPELEPFRLDRLANPVTPPGLGVLA
jgi:glycine/D-amino acid oxidase-like deaminating enzyme